MPNRDLLVLAGDASERLERHGLVACGRRENGVTRVDFWSHEGRAFRHELTDETVTVEEIVLSCLAMAGIADVADVEAHASEGASSARGRRSHLS